MMVCSKLLNFTKNHIHYGVLFCEPVDPERDSCPDYFKIIQQPMDFGTVLNKLYLDIYKSSSEFWYEIGLVIRNCLKFNKEETSDLHILGLTLRECTIFLYDQWYHLSEQRYNQLKEEIGHTLISSETLRRSDSHIRNPQLTEKNSVSEQKITSQEMKDEKEEAA